MNHIRTHCPTCGEVTLDSDAIVVELVGQEESGHYRFDCPGCGKGNRRPIGSRVVSIMLQGGARKHAASTSARITTQEIEAFSAFLNGDDAWLEEIAASE